MITGVSQIDLAGKKKPSSQQTSPAFNVNYTAPSAIEAQQICTELTSSLLENDLKSRQAASQGTTLFLTNQVEDAKRNLDDLDKKLAAFKKQYMGQLPG